MAKLDVSKYKALAPERIRALLEPRLEVLEEQHLNALSDATVGPNPTQEARADELWDEITHLRAELDKLPKPPAARS